jgi:predicted Zn-dependent protease
VVLCVAGFFWLSYRSNQVANVFEQRATLLEQEGHWQEAASYLSRYLQLSPADAEARVRLVEAVEHTVTTGRQRRYLLGLLYEAMGFLPDRHDLRLKLAEQLLEVGSFTAAETEAQKVLASSDVEEKRAARKVIALSLRARARTGGLISIDKAASALAAALDENPADVDLASLTAELFRDYPESAGIDNASTKADEIMDRLVEAKPSDPDALIARYKYRRRYAVGNEARRDLESILARDPNHLEALLLLADEEAEAGDLVHRAAAEQKLRQVVELAPADSSGHIALARLYAAQGDSKRAFEVLSRGKAQLKEPSVELDALLASVLIELHRLDEADKVLAEIDEHSRRLLPELTTPGRTKLENLRRLLQARVHIARNNLVPAIRELNAVIASVGEADVSAGALERVHANAMLAGAMSKLGRPDLAAARWSEVANYDPNYVGARLNAAAAYLELGRAGDAVRELEAYLQSPNSSVEAWLLLVQAHLQQQIGLSAKERNWSEFLTTLEAAKKKLPGRWEPSMAEVLYWHSLGTEETKRRAVSQLKELEKTHGQNHALLARLVLTYQQLGATSDAERALAKYEKREPSRLRRTLVGAGLRVQQGRAEEASKLIETAAAASSGAERRELRAAGVRILVAVRKLDAAQKAAAEMIAALPKEPALLLLGIEIALMRQDFVSAARWEDQLKALKSGDDFDWRYCRARRLVAQFAKLDAKSRSELDSLLDSLRAERPDWYPVVALSGQYADATGNRPQAIDAYRTAIDLGERRPEIFERMVTALYTEGRFSEANQYLARLSADQPSDGRAESFAIALAVKENRLGAALEMAKQAVQRGSNDPMHHVWLANLLSLNNRRPEAERVFRNSIQRFPKDSRVWNALMTYFVRINELDKARRTLEHWSEEAAVDEATRHYILAQGFELLENKAAAEKHYRATVASDSKNVDARLRLAKLLLSSDIGAARSQFEEVLKLEAGNSEARRYLASVLAASGDEGDWNRAVHLLESRGEGDHVSGQIADDRLRAMLLSRRGRNRTERLANCEAARRILMTRLNQQDGASLDLDRMLLAGLYEQEAAMRDDFTLVLAARDALRPLVDRDNPPADYITSYIQLLLRHVERRRKAGKSDLDIDEQLAVFIDDARLRIAELEASLPRNATSAQRFVPLAFRVRLLAAEKKGEEGWRLLDEFGEKELTASLKDADRAKLLLQLGNLAAAVDYRDKAEGWYRQLLAIAPSSYVLLAQSLSDQERFSDAVEVCLRAAKSRPAAEIATVLSQILSTVEASKELDERVQPVIAAALDADGDNVELLMSVAVRHVTEDNYDDAIGLFRRVLALQPDHTLALNNLATLLAERPNELGEAQRCVERAMAIAGRSPALLDTLGTILIRKGQSDQAVVALEEAVAGTASDPRYYFHLAVAYQRARREGDAKQALDSARRFGLDQAILTSGDRELLASLQAELRTAANY